MRRLLSWKKKKKVKKMKNSEEQNQAGMDVPSLLDAVRPALGVHWSHSDLFLEFK